MKVSVVIPCYNEEETVIPLYNEITEVFARRGIDYELVYVNDGSSDGTLCQLRLVAQTAAVPVRVVNFSRNFGKEAGIYAGLKASRGEYVALMDGDMQHPPEVVADMADYLDANPDTDSVAAVQTKRREGCVLSFFKKCFYKIINRAASVEFVSGASDFRMFRRAMVDAVLDITEYYRFSKGIFSFVGFNTHYMPYTARERGGGRTKWSFWKLTKYAVDGIIGYTTAPLRFTTVLGGLVSLASFIYLIAVVVQKLAFGNDVPGYPTLVVLILLLGGIQLLGLGIIGEYLGRNYVETKRRPIYIAKEIIDNGKDTEKEE